MNITIQAEERIERKLDRMGDALERVVREVAGLAERFPTRAELMEMSGALSHVRKDLGGVQVAVGKLQTDVLRLWMFVTAIGAVASGAAATLLAQAIGG